MGFLAWMSVTAAKQGQFKGESPNPRRRGWIPLVAFEYGVSSPRDLATGQASGKRQHEPVRILKEWGAASPQILTALSTNEVLHSVNFEFGKVGPDGRESVYQTVTLTNAAVSSVKQFTFGWVGEWKADTQAESRELERVELTFEKIEMQNTEGQTEFRDDWQQ